VRGEARTFRVLVRTDKADKSCKDFPLLLQLFSFRIKKRANIINYKNRESDFCSDVFFFQKEKEEVVSKAEGF
jgi:hypothetical protein